MSDIIWVQQIVVGYLYLPVSVLHYVPCCVVVNRADKGPTYSAHTNVWDISD